MNHATADTAMRSGGHDEPRALLGQTLGRLSSALAADRIGTGGLAELRRMEGAPVLPPGFWHLLYVHVPEALRRDWLAEKAWAALLGAMAELAPHPHQRGHRFGEALARTGYAEDRFVRLLRPVADPDEEAGRIARELRLAARWLAHQGVRFDWFAPAALVLATAGRVRGFDAERARHDIARDYFVRGATPHDDDRRLETEDR